MNFIRSIVNEEELILDEDVEKFVEELELLENIDELDEDALDRVLQRVRNRELAFYRFIVGAENLMMTSKFLELAKNGKSIPSSMVKAYLPAIELLDDIVQAGPGYIQLLKTLQKRAKKSK